MAHRYFVEWSAPNYRNAGSTVVLAGTKPGAIAKAKEKLGDRVKKQHLNHFDAWRNWSAKQSRRIGIAMRKGR